MISIPIYDTELSTPFSMYLPIEARMLKNFDWVSFVLNFIAGTFFGGMFGLCWWRYAPFGYFIPLPPLKWILACALIFGVVIGYLGDRFWDALFHIHQS